MRQQQACFLDKATPRLEHRVAVVDGKFLEVQCSQEVMVARAAHLGGSATDIPRARQSRAPPKCARCDYVVVVARRCCRALHLLYVVFWPLSSTSGPPKHLQLLMWARV